MKGSVDVHKFRSASSFVCFCLASGLVKLHNGLIILDNGGNLSYHKRNAQQAFGYPSSDPSEGSF